MKPKISLIVPVYNNNSVLEQCFDMLRMQDLPELEIVAIDDCSTDNSWEVLQMMALRDPRIVLRQTDNHIGVGAVRNMGMKLAHGEFIGFVNPYGGMPPNYFSVLYNAAMENKSDMAVTGMVMMMPDGKVVNPGMTNAHCLCQFRCWRGIFRASFLKKVKAQFGNTTVQDGMSFEQAIISTRTNAVVLPQMFYTENVNTMAPEAFVAGDAELTEVEKIYPEFWEAMCTRDLSPDVCLLALMDRFAFLRDVLYFRLVKTADKLRLLEFMMQLYRMTPYNRAMMWEDPVLLQMVERRDMLGLIEYMDLRRVNRVRRYMFWRWPWMVVYEMYRFKTYRLFGRITVWRRVLMPV